MTEQARVCEKHLGYALVFVSCVQLGVTTCRCCSPPALNLSAPGVCACLRLPAADMLTYIQDILNSSTTQAPELPTVLLAQVLQHLPLQQRLKHAWLVSKAWQAAACAATTELQCSVKPGTAAALQAWISKHAAQLVSLNLSAGSRGDVLLNLPFERLRNMQILVLECVQLPAVAPSTNSSPADDAPQLEQAGSATPLLPQLRRLELRSCKLHSMECALHLAGSTHLTCLVVVPDGNSSTPTPSPANAAIVSLLRHQQQRLRVLHLPIIRVHAVGSDVIAAVTAMQQLQDLSLTLGSGACGSRLAGLPSTLTRLALTDSREVDRGGVIDAASETSVNNPTLPPQGLPHLSFLQHLKLDECRIEAAVLRSMPQLRHLELHGRLLPYDDYFPTQEAIAALLQALSTLTRLQHLSLSGLGLSDAEPPYAAFSALTLSSDHLTELKVTDNGGPPLPTHGVMEHMFPSGRQLSGLRRLTIHREPDWEEAFCFECEQDLARMINCCQRLESLDITEVVGDISLAPLLRLPDSCRSLQLSVAGEQELEDIADVLAQLVQLTSLNVSLDHSREAFKSSVERVRQHKRCCDSLSAYLYSCHV